MAHDVTANILSIDDLEKAAEAKMDSMTRGYFNSGSGELITLRENISSYDQYRIRPRVLRDVSRINPSTQFLGRKITFPVCIAPTAMQRMAHPDGELATVRAAVKMGLAMGLSSFATTPMEDVAATAEGKIDQVLQVYVMQNRKTTEMVVRRAVKAGYKALFLTVDTPYLGRRHAETRTKFQLPSHLSLGNFIPPKDPITPAIPSNKIPGGNKDIGRADVRTPDGLPNFGLIDPTTGQVNPNDATLSWKDIAWLRSLAPGLQIWLKGILTPEDVELAIQHGADGVVVSNHGGRQLDQALSTLDALPSCVEAAKGGIPIHVDGGVRRGSDVFKALALGADMVWVGRIPIWGLVVDGQAGVELGLRILYEEFVLCMALAGCTSVKEISREHLASRGLKWSKL